jgi:hypothetical protein
MNYENFFLISLGFTIFIETLVLIILFRFLFKSLKIENKRIIATGFITSFATLPYLWFILPHLIHSAIWFYIIAESFAILIESFIIHIVLRIKFRTSFILSSICNIISFSLGYLIFRILLKF